MDANARQRALPHDAQHSNLRRHVPIATGSCLGQREHVSGVDSDDGVVSCNRVETADGHACCGD